MNNDFGVSGQATGGGYTYYLGTTSKSVQTGNTYQYTGLTEKTAYTFKVIAKDKAGNTSEKTLGLTTKSIITDFAYTGSAQTYTVPQTGKYKLEVWGAQGGIGRTESGRQTPGGKGGYSAGVLTCSSDVMLYCLVGGKGNNLGSTSVLSGGFNGGGGLTRFPEIGEVR